MGGVSEDATPERPLTTRVSNIKGSIEDEENTHTVGGQVGPRASPSYKLYSSNGRGKEGKLGVCVGARDLRYPRGVIDPRSPGSEATAVRFSDGPLHFAAYYHRKLVALPPKLVSPGGIITGLTRHVC